MSLWTSSGFSRRSLTWEWRAAMLLAPLLLGGCTGLLTGPVKLPPTSYLLSLETDIPSLPPGTTAARRVQGGGQGVMGRTERDQSGGPVTTILVSRPEATAGYASQRMAYLEQDYRLDYFADHEWVDTPAIMLVPLLVESLKEESSFWAVSEDGRGIQGDLRLDTVIESLYQDFRLHPSQVRIRLRVRLVDPAEGRIRASRVFETTEPAPTDDPYGGVVATNRALAKLLPDIAGFAAHYAR